MEINQNNIVSPFVSFIFNLLLLLWCTYQQCLSKRILKVNKAVTKEFQLNVKKNEDNQIT